MQLSLGIYKKQLLFFAGIILVLGGIFYFVNQQLSQASVSEVAVPTKTGIYNIDVYLNESGVAQINGKDYNNLVSDGRDNDELRYIVTDKEGIFIDEININIHLPEAVSKGLIPQKIYAVHGVGSYESYVEDSETLVYSASNLSPSATFTIVAEFPKGIFNFPTEKKVLSYFYNLSPEVWLLISVVFSLIPLVILLFMFRQTIRDWRVAKPKEMMSMPPNDLSPAEAGVLIEGKVSARSIAATLLDLAQRGVIQVVSRSDSFAFGKRKSLDMDSDKNNSLRPFEKTLLSKIFSEEELRSTVKNIQVRIGRHVFSRKVAEVYLEIYQNIAQKGYFSENPSRMHAKYRTIGLVFFFVGLAGFVYGIFWAPDPKFYLLFWATMIFTSLIIIKMSPQLPIRTKKGQYEMSEWLKFKNFLTDPQPIGYIEGTQNTFEKFLPYAITMRCETEWAKRFIEHPFRQPDWYFSDRSVVILEDFINDLFPVVGFVSEELSAAKEPIV